VTGKVLSTVTLPRRIDPKASQVAAVGDGHMFALALSSFPRTRFYRLRVTDGGRSARLTALQHAAYSAEPGLRGWYIGSCQLAAADRTGSHLLVSCDRFGRLDRGRFTALPGAAPQSAVAAAW